MEIKITSANRGAAKKLLTFCGTDSRLVRTMSLADLSLSLQRAVNQGLITQAQIARLLGREQDEWKQESNDERDGNGKRDEKYDESDEDFNKQDESRAKSSGNDSNDGDGDRDSSSDSKSNDKGENDESETREGDSESESDESDESESEGDSNSESDDESNDDGDEGESDEKSDEKSDENSEGESESESENDESNDDEQNGDEQDDTESKHEVFARVLKYIRAGLNVALVGPAGTGKSYLARQVAKELGRDFYVNGAMLSKYDLAGYQDAHGTYHATPAYHAFKHGGVHCFDELDASAPDAVVAFNGMTDDQPFYTFPCGQTDKHPEYVAIACMNTWGNGATADYVGRYKQDAASMSRFVRVFVDYDRKIETKIAGPHTDILHRVWALREACNVLGIRHVVSTRMIIQAIRARTIGKSTKTEIDADILFAGLDDAAIRQLKTRVNAIAKELDAGHTLPAKTTENGDE